MDRSTFEISKGERFEFGENWARFLIRLNETRINEAEKSLKTMLGVESLEGKSFLDVGSGSGLFSLAARRLGARVHSFDYDIKSVSCTQELMRLYFPNDHKWRIEQGSALDREYLLSLGQFDIVYSWGVLHHTGNLWLALENIKLPVSDTGLLYISIYNDQGIWSLYWRKVKSIYNLLPNLLKIPFALLIMSPIEIRSLLFNCLKLDPVRYFKTWTITNRARGMNKWHDLMDWVGGYPFEVAKPEQIFDFFSSKDFLLIKLKTVGGTFGCNEFVFKKSC